MGKGAPLTPQAMDRRAAITGMAAVAVGVAAAGAAGCSSLRSNARDFLVQDFGAIGDGIANDTAAIQRAVDAASTQRGRVVLRGGHKYLCGAVRLRSNIEFHLQGDAELLASEAPGHYANPVVEAVSDGVAVSRAVTGLLYAKDCDGLSISGTGKINGRSPLFMSGFDAENEWWVPKAFRPKLLVLENCTNLTLRDIALVQAPSWTVHLVGCRKVLIDHISIHNQLDVPNCDGIDPDHCQDVEIRNCHIVCGDDAIVIKTTAAFGAYGASRNIHVHDCVLETQDSGIKIGTETTQDIHDILFERCEIVNGCRGICIQLRDRGNVFNVVFRDIRFVSRYFSAPWWGRGEAISFTALPRNAQTQLGSLHDITVQNVAGRAENSVRVDGHASSRVRNITLDNVRVTLERWTRYPGPVFDNRPTSAVEPLEAHRTPGISIRNADNITLRSCAIEWGANRPEYFTHALHAEGVTALKLENFTGTAAHPERDVPVRIE